MASPIGKIRFSLLPGAIVLFLACATTSFAQNTKKQESEKARLENEIAILDNQIKENSAKSNSVLSNLSLIQKKISSRQALIAEGEKEIAGYDSQIRKKQGEVKAIQNRLDTLSVYYSRLVKNAYKNRDAKIWYMYMLASDNLGQAIRRISYLRDFSQMMNEQAKKIKETQAELAAETEKLTVLKKKAESLRKSRLAELGMLEAEQQESRQMAGSLKRNRSLFQRQLSAKQQQVDALNREIQRIIRGAGSSKKSEPLDYKLSGEFASNKGKLPWPAIGPVVDHFGQHFHPVFTRVKMPFNNGVTIALNRNSVIKAVFNGVVSQIVVVPGYNKCVLVQHGKYFSFYCKLENVNVKAGDKVKTGQVLGTVDTINGETQLHFQIWQDKNPQNPELWLRAM